MKKDSLDEATFILKSCEQARVWISKNNLQYREETWNALTNTEWLISHLANTSVNEDEKNYLFDTIEQVITLLIPEYPEVEGILKNITTLRVNKNTNDFENYFNALKLNQNINIKIRSLMLHYLSSIKFYALTDNQLNEKKANFSFLSLGLKSFLSEEIIAAKIKERYLWSEINRRFQNEKLKNKV